MCANHAQAGPAHSPCQHDNCLKNNDTTAIEHLQLHTLVPSLCSYQLTDPQPNPEGSCSRPINQSAAATCSPHGAHRYCKYIHIIGLFIAHEFFRQVGLFNLLNCFLRPQVLGQNSLATHISFHQAGGQGAISPALTNEAG